MSKKLLLPILVIVFQLPLSVLGQSVGKQVVEHELKLLVKNYDEFMARFNFTMDPFGNPIKDTAHVYLENVAGIQKIDRKLSVSFLIDAELCERHPDLCERFVDDVTDKENPYLLNFHDPNWYCVRPATVRFNGSEQSLSLTMQVEVHDGRQSKWVICGVDAPFLPAIKTEHDKDRLIAPDSNSSGFVALRRAFEDVEHFDEYLPRSFGTDGLTRLATACKNGQLEYVSAKGQQEYHLLQIPGWVVMIQYFKRKDGNRGWLISELHPLTDEEKEIYLKEYLNIGQ